MHSACDQVEEGTVLNPAHSFHAPPSISPTSTTIELCKTWQLASHHHLGRSAYSPLPHRGEDGGEGMVNSFCLLSLSSCDIPSFVFLSDRFGTDSEYCLLNSDFCFDGGVL
jgi:hypothetical protein